MRIYITGFMGSGKSTVGMQLAARMNYRFIDLDNYIEQQTGITIGDIFSLFGEFYFRQMEQKALKSTFDLENIIVSTGGGTPCYYDNIQQINTSGISIYLKLPPESLVSRLKQSARRRPLLRGLLPSQIEDLVYKMLDERKIFYEQAQYIVEGSNIKANDLMSLLINDLKKKTG